MNRRPGLGWGLCRRGGGHAGLFWLADLEGRPADPRRFNTDFADQPVVLVSVGLFLSALSCATLSTA
ncbi:hypothetical protein ACIRQF_00100 [Streptomyces sp. NPDC101191]|uniref:hypothetical protein n=1 Tax=Streptomyces sp. NPDC101191 TaxID=3366126 RepID=UPI00381D0B37